MGAYYNERTGQVHVQERAGGVGGGVTSAADRVASDYEAAQFFDRQIAEHEGQANHLKGRKAKHEERVKRETQEREAAEKKGAPLPRDENLIAANEPGDGRGNNPAGFPVKTTAGEAAALDAPVHENRNVPERNQGAGSGPQHFEPQPQFERQQPQNPQQGVLHD